MYKNQQYFKKHSPGVTILRSGKDSGPCFSTHFIAQNIKTLCTWITGLKKKICKSTAEVGVFILLEDVSYNLLQTSSLPEEIQAFNMHNIVSSAQHD